MPILKKIFPILSIIIATPITLNKVYAVGCTVSSTGLAFGTYNPTSTSPNQANVSIMVGCSSTIIPTQVNYSVLLGTGNGQSFAPRKMANTTNNQSPNMQYNIYTDANSYKLVWGDGTGNTYTKSSTINLTLLPGQVSTDTLTGYGQIPQQQSNLIPGNFSDSVAITVMMN